MMQKSYRGYSDCHRQKAKKILGNKCCVCNNLKNIHVHHKDNNPFNNKIYNLEILCAKCHKKLHWSLIPKKLTRKEERLKRLKEIFYKKFNSYDFYTTKDLCKKMKLSRERIRQLRQENKVIYTKVKGTYLHFLK